MLVYQRVDDTCTDLQWEKKTWLGFPYHLRHTSTVQPNGSLQCKFPKTHVLLEACQQGFQLWPWMSPTTFEVIWTHQRNRNWALTITRTTTSPMPCAWHIPIKRGQRNSRCLWNSSLILEWPTCFYLKNRMMNARNLLQDIANSCENNSDFPFLSNSSFRLSLASNARATQSSSHGGTCLWSLTGNLSGAELWNPAGIAIFERKAMACYGLLAPGIWA